MKINKELKLEGIVVGVCLLLMWIGFTYWYYASFNELSQIQHIFMFITTSPLFVLVVIATSLHWIWKLYKYQKTETTKNP